MAEIRRVGIGYDLHRLVAGRPLGLGGVKVPFEKGLAGYSDADVVLHAVIDALLGAAGRGDIGERFPDTDPAYRHADSKDLLGQVLTEVLAAGFEPVCVDVIIHAEQPRLAEHKPAIRQSLAGLLGLPIETVNVKAKTNEGLDAVGRGEAIACWACVGLTTAKTGS